MWLTLQQHVSILYPRTPVTEDKSYGCCDYIPELQKSFLKAPLTAGQYFLFDKTSKLIVLVLQLCFLDHISSSWPADNETGGFLWLHLTWSVERGTKYGKGEGNDIQQKNGPALRVTPQVTSWVPRVVCTRAAWLSRFLGCWMSAVFKRWAPFSTNVHLLSACGEES